jgi:hypothetical protein
MKGKDFNLMNSWASVLNIAKEFSYNTDKELKDLEAGKKFPTEIKFIKSQERAQQNSRYVVFSINTKETDTLVISFRGTEFSSWANWKNNANDKPTEVNLCEGKKIKVHQGFYNSLNSLSDTIISDIESKENLKNTDLVFTGHSLGGAMATLAYIFADCKLKKEVKSISLITFGSPRVLTTQNVNLISEIATKRNGLIANVHIRGDLVGSVPLKSDGYRHFTPLVIFDYNQKGLDDEEFGILKAWWYSFKNGLRVTAAVVNPIAFIATSALKLSKSDFKMPEDGKIFTGYFSDKDDLPDMKTNVKEIYYDHSIPREKFSFRIRLHTWYQFIDGKMFVEHLRHCFSRK